MFTRLAFSIGLMSLTSGCFGGGGGGGPIVDEPYDSCVVGDVCSVAGFDCVGSTLPASSYTGNFCTYPCTSSNDCPQDVSNYEAICVLYAQDAGQCYLTCPAGGGSCPYGQGCFSYPDAFTGDTIELCTP